VVVDVRVSAAGRVEDALLVTAAGEPFDQAALAAVRRARFAPAERAGQRVASRVAMRLHFRLER
jgi:TonB family protein